MAACAFAAAGWATIVAQVGQKVVVNSAPQGATVAIQPGAELHGEFLEARQSTSMRC